MNAPRTSLTVADAEALVLRATAGAAAESVHLREALHRVVADDLNATVDSPPFDKSLMDGFAVNAAAILEHSQSDSVSLQVLETVTAGHVPAYAVDQHTAIRIMTGSPLPPGCDCVIPIEQVQFEESTPDRVTVTTDRIGPEQCLIRRGTAARRGEPLIHRGTRLQSQQIGALAEFGIAEVPVVRRPTVAVLATGDELVPAEQQPGEGQIRNSNEPMLCAMANELGARAVPLGIARDTVDSLSGLIRSGLQHDILLLSGGVSAGTLDLVPSQLTAAGVRKVFHGVDLKPGRPLWFGVLEGDGNDGVSNKPGRRCLVFGLPGNPVSSLTCFHLFVAPAIRQLLGEPHVARRQQATLQHDQIIRGSRPVWHPACISLVAGQLAVSLVRWSGSSDLRATVEANGMCLLQPEHGPYDKGQVVECLLWNSLA